MKTTFIITCVFFALCASLLTVGPLAAVQVEEFTTDPAPRGWTGLNNTAGGNSYGWSSGTNNTNNDATNGEAGGTFVRANNPFDSYFGDLTLGPVGVFTLNDALSASGWFYFDATNVNGIPDFNGIIGFFNSTSAGANQDGNQLGFAVADVSNTSMRVFARSVVSDQGLDQTLAGTFAHQTNRFFNFVYDPNIGNGQLTLTLDSDTNPGNGILATAIVNLSAANRAAGATFNAFGLANNENGAQPSIQLFIDDVVYTPEPASGAMLLLGGILLLRVQRRRAG